MVVKWFYHKDGHHGSLLYIVKEQHWGDKSESLVLEQEANYDNAQVNLKGDGRGNGLHHAQVLHKYVTLKMVLL